MSTLTKQKDTDELICREGVADGAGVNFRICGKRANYAVIMKNGPRIYRCGIHIKRFRKRVERRGPGILRIEQEM